jgi:hypothetical protein
MSLFKKKVEDDLLEVEEKHDSTSKLKKFIIPILLVVIIGCMIAYKVISTQNQASGDYFSNLESIFTNELGHFKYQFEVQTGEKGTLLRTTSTTDNMSLEDLNSLDSSENTDAEAVTDEDTDSNLETDGVEDSSEGSSESDSSDSEEGSDDVEIEEDQGSDEVQDNSDNEEGSEDTSSDEDLKIVDVDTGETIASDVEEYQQQVVEKAKENQKHTFTDWSDYSRVKISDWEYPKYTVTIEGTTNSLEPLETDFTVNISTPYFDGDTLFTEVNVKDGVYNVNILAMHI